MKTKILVFLLMLLATQGFAQISASNADGSIKFRGNVAIIVHGRSYTFKNGNFTKQIKDQPVSDMCTAINAFCIQKLQNMCFAVVNRDNDAFQKVKQLIEENKLEDYMNGLSVQAKAQGADYLLVVDYTSYYENDKATQAFVTVRLLNVENNVGYHYNYSSDVDVLKNNEENLRESASKMVTGFSKFMDEVLFEVFAEQYGITSIKDTDATLVAHQPNGRISPEDKFYTFQFSKGQLVRNGKTSPLQILDLVAVGESPKIENGGLHVRLDNSIKNPNEVVLFRNNDDPDVSGTAVMPWTYYPMPFSTDTREGFLKNRVNNAIYAAMTRHPGIQLIEVDHLPELKKERELQKTEDFINGHVVEQMKAVGAQAFFKIEDFSLNGSQVSFTLSLHSVQTNTMLRSVEVVSSIDNIEQEMYKQMCDRALSPCNVKVISKKEMEVLTGWSLYNGAKCKLVYVKPIKNPANNAIVYQNTEIASLEVIEYHGNKSVIQVDEIFSKDDFTDLEEKSKAGQILIKMDGSHIKSDKSNISKVEKTADKQKTKKNGFLKNLMNGVQVIVN